MRFRTEYIGDRGPFRLSSRKGIVTIGSCFAENIVKRMQQSLWKADNPLGTLFNPLSIELLLNQALSASSERNKFLETKIFQVQDVWHSWWFDTKFSSTDKQELLDKCLNAVDQLIKALSEADALIITFGTSRCYWHKDQEIGIVANCHKMPSADFHCRRISITEITEIWNSLIDRIHNQYPLLKIIFTVSPVRHVKDGFIENTRSKATLILGIEEIIKDREYCDYFPAYEIMCDDLRDYRFYASDLVHPSQEGIEYIWEKFCERYLNPEDVKRIKAGENIYMRMNHIPIVPDSRASVAFKAKTEELLKQFKAEE